MDNEDRPARDTKRRWARSKPVILLVMLGAALLVYFEVREDLSLASLAERETALRDFKSDHPVMVIGIAFAIYVLVTGLSLPFAAILTLVLGWFLHFWTGLLVVSFASTTGSTLAFLMSRFLLRDAVERRFGDRLRSFNEALRREGAFFLFSLRLIPAVPFFVINLVMGLAPIRTRTFWWVSQLGMLPGTAVYVYAGAQFPTLRELADRGLAGILSPRLIVAFILLGVFPLVVKRVWSRFRKRALP